MVQTILNTLGISKAKTEELSVTAFLVAKAKINAEYAGKKIDSMTHARHMLFLDRKINVRTMVVGAVRSGVIKPSQARVTEANLTYF
jgi:hypothetical protein